MSEPTTIAAVPLTVRLLWPAGRFYWSVLQPEPVAGTLRRARPTRDYLDSLFEEDLPVEIDGLHRVYADFGDGRFLACALSREALRGLPGGTIALAPQAIPDELGLDETCVGPSAIELLTGDFEPADLRRQRFLHALVGIAACIICALLLSLGLLRRASSALTQARDLNADSLALVRLLVPSPGSSPDADFASASWRLRQELDALRPIHAADADHARSPDARLALADLLAHLPRTPSLRTDVLAVTPQTITLNVATDADPQLFLKPLTAPRGWTLDEPRLSASRGDATTSLAIQMRRASVNERGHAGSGTDVGGAR